VPSITIPVDHTSMRLEEINEYRRLRQAEADMNLDAYVLMAKSTREDLEVHFLASLYSSYKLGVNKANNFSIWQCSSIKRTFLQDMKFIGTGWL
jgi:hypothetical protein